MHRLQKIQKVKNLDEIWILFSKKLLLVSSMNETVRCANSSMIDSFQYNEEDQTLQVHFKGGQIYDYFFVPAEVAETFKKVCENPAESAGRWFSQKIRGTFEYQKKA